MNNTNKIEFHTNAILDAESDTTLISQDIADKLNLQGTNKTLNITKAVATKKKILSKMVNFQIKVQNANCKAVDIENVWVFKTLNIPYSKIEENSIRQYDHLHGTAFPKISNYDVTVLIGTGQQSYYYNKATKNENQGIQLQ